MSGRRSLPGRGSAQEPFQVVRERVKGTGTDLTCFYVMPGANFYVFSYQKGGVRRHTFIDTGDSRYREQIFSILEENDISPAGIERIIITHRHPDHCGLADLLAGESGAKILVHPNFRGFIEGGIREEERRWLGELKPSRLKEHDIEYLADKGEARSINGVDFPGLGQPVEVGEGCRLEIFACPERKQTHSPDQIIVLYSAEDSRPTDSFLFSGDLWLMQGPLFSWDMRSVSRHLSYGRDLMANLMSGRGTPPRDPREQDAEAKEALKKGFILTRVKPGHGQEFLGSRILPRSLLADRDLLVELGYSMDASKSILKGRDVAPMVAALREQAYTSFTGELLLWRELGYSPDEICGLLARIYKEQSGGGRLVEPDRKERRERLEETLARLTEDEAMSHELRQLAQSTLSNLKAIP